MAAKPITDPKLAKQVAETQKLLTPYVKKSLLADKHLARPPFRQLHDIIMQVTSSTGFFKGLFTPDELDPSKLQSKESKVVFLQKLIDVLAIASGQSISLKPNKVLSGQEVEKTNEFLQLLGKTLKTNVKSTDAVKSVLGGKTSGEASGAPAVTAAAAAAPAPTKVKQDKNAGSKGAGGGGDGKSKTKDENKPAAAAGTKKAGAGAPSTKGDGESSSNKNKDRQGAGGGAGKNSRPPSRKNSLETGATATQQPESSKAVAVVSKQQQPSQSPQKAAAGARVNGPGATNSSSAAAGAGKITPASSQRKKSEVDLAEIEDKNLAAADSDDADDDDDTEVKNSSTSTKKHVDLDNVTSSQSLKSSTANASKPSAAVASVEFADSRTNSIESVVDQTTNEGAPPAPATSKQKEHQQQQPPPPTAAASRGRPGGQVVVPPTPGRQPMVVDHSIQGPVQNSVPSEEGAAVAAAQAEQEKQRSDFMRPMSSRPGAPRPRTATMVWSQEEAHPFRPPTSRVTNVLVDKPGGTAAPDDDDDEADPFIIQDKPAALLDDAEKNPFGLSSLAKNNNSLSGDPSGGGGRGSGVNVEELPAEQRGLLVNQLIEAKKEFEDGKGKGGRGGAGAGGQVGADLNEVDRSRLHQHWEAEIDKLKGLLQTMARASNPLGKLMEYVQEDVEAMLSEMGKYKEENLSLEIQLEDEQRKMKKELAPLQLRLDELDDLIKDQEDAVIGCKLEVLEQEEKIGKILTGLENIPPKKEGGAGAGTLYAGSEVILQHKVVWR